MGKLVPDEERGQNASILGCYLIFACFVLGMIVICGMTGHAQEMNDATDFLLGWSGIPSFAEWFVALFF